MIVNPQVCSYCGNVVAGIRKNAHRFCGRSCRNAFYHDIYNNARKQKNITNTPEDIEVEKTTRQVHIDKLNNDASNHMYEKHSDVDATMSKVSTSKYEIIIVYSYLKYTCDLCGEKLGTVNIERTYKNTELDQKRDMIEESK